MTIEGKINDEMLQYDIDRAAAIISEISLGKTNKY